MTHLRHPLPLIAALLVLLVACKPQKSEPMDDSRPCAHANPIDEIIHTSYDGDRLTRVMDFLAENPTFADTSSEVGYHWYSCDSYDRYLIWQDCGPVRVYSIPCEANYGTYCDNIIQMKSPDGAIDTGILSDNWGGISGLFNIRGQDGKIHYILRTRLIVMHQGEELCESVVAFTIENGRPVREQLFHAKNRQYDKIDVSCGDHRYLPLDYGSTALICTEALESEEPTSQPQIVIAEINASGWPTGMGLKYQWTGSCFEYVGKCHYDANDMLYE